MEHETATAAAGATLRAAHADDVPRLTQMIAEAHLPPLFIEQFLDGFVVAERDGEIIGCGGLEKYEDTAAIRSVVIDPAARGLGLGRVISERLIENARRAGAREIYLFTADAHDFWHHLGFEDVTLDDFAEAARASWQYQFISQNLQQAAFDLFSMRLRFD